MTTSMHSLQAMALGAVQGVTEFLPVSSSGHLILARHYFNMPEVPLLFDVYLHVATLIVVCFFYRATIGLMLKAFVHLIGKKMDDIDKIYLRYFIIIVASTVMTIIVALVLRLFTSEQPSVVFVAIMMLITATFLLYRPKKGKRLDKDYKDLGPINAIITGIAQGFGTLPGISRSGITITSGLVSGMKREVAGEFAFILSIPAILGALVLTSIDYSVGSQTISFAAVAAGSITAAITGFFSLKMLLWIVKKARLWLFSIYLVIVSLTILITSL